MKTVYDYKQKQKQLKITGIDPTNIKELFESVKRSINHNLKQYPGVDLIHLHMFLAYKPLISNFNNKPLTGVYSNALGDSVPNGYEGFVGNINFRISGIIQGFGSSLLNDSLTYTGTGGAGNYGMHKEIASIYYNAPNELKKQYPRPETYGFDYTVFLDDFPKLTEELIEYKKEYEKYEEMVTAAIIADKIKPSPPPIPKRSYRWSDPIWEEKDKNFIKLVNEEKAKRKEKNLPYK